MTEVEYFRVAYLVLHPLDKPLPARSQAPAPAPQCPDTEPQKLFDLFEPRRMSGTISSGAVSDISTRSATAPARRDLSPRALITPRVGEKAHCTAAATVRYATFASPYNTACIVV